MRGFFFWLPEVLLASQEGLCSMELCRWVNEYVAIVDWCWQDETEVHGEKVKVPIFPRRISHKPGWDRNPGLRRGWPVTNRPIHGMVISYELGWFTEMTSLKVPESLRISEYRKRSLLDDLMKPGFTGVCAVAVRFRISVWGYRRVIVSCKLP